MSRRVRIRRIIGIGCALRIHWMIVILEKVILLAVGEVPKEEDEVWQGLVG